VRRLQRVHGRAGRFPVPGRARRVCHQRGGHHVRAAQHGHERAGTAADTVRHAGRSVPDRRGRRGGIHRRVPVVHIQLCRHQNVPVPAAVDRARHVHVVRRPVVLCVRFRHQIRAEHQREDHKTNRR